MACRLSIAREAQLRALSVHCIVVFVPRSTDFRASVIPPVERVVVADVQHVVVPLWLHLAAQNRAGRCLPKAGPCTLPRQTGHHHGEEQSCEQEGTEEDGPTAFAHLLRRSIANSKGHNLGYGVTYFAVNSRIVVL